jgi:hypothetical protein
MWIVRLDVLVHYVLQLGVLANVMNPFVSHFQNESNPLRIVPESELERPNKVVYSVIGHSEQNTMLTCHADKVGADVVECACVIELPELNGRSKLGNAELFILIEKEGLWCAGCHLI